CHLPGVGEPGVREEAQHTALPVQRGAGIRGGGPAVPVTPGVAVPVPTGAVTVAFGVPVTAPGGGPGTRLPSRAAEVRDRHAPAGPQHAERLAPELLTGPVGHVVQRER